MFNRCRIFQHILIWFCCLVMAVGPVFAPVRTQALTIGEERDIGEKLLYMIRTEFSLLDDPDISQYINDLGQQVLAQAGPQYFDYRFFVVPSNEFNAFAAPSGLIFFFTGLIETMKTEDELISVMAHEIGHVVSRHIASRSDKSAKVGAISMAMALASLALGDPSLAAGLFTGFQAAGQAAYLHFSRTDEEEADRLAYNWLHQLRRDPKAMEGMLRSMRRIARYRSEQIPPYLLTHPNPEARLDYVQSLLDYQRDKVAENYYAPTDNFDFIRMKYRVMVAASDPQKIRAFFTGTLSSARDSGEKAMAAYGLALLEAKELNFAKALEHLAAVKNHYSDRSIIDVDTGIVYLDSGETEKALELFTQAVEKNPHDMYAVFHLARALEKTGQVESAEKMYRKVMKVMPEYSRIYFELGRLKARQGQLGMSNYYLAKYYLYEGKVELATEYFTKTGKDLTVAESMREESELILQRLEELKKL
jgi:beta-barrel assembly-enhancing protease